MGRMGTTDGQAWQPLTPRGVGRFARASVARLLAAQGVVALLAAATVTWCVATGWFPVIEAAVGRLPNHALLRSGRLDWPDSSPQWLAEGRCLAVVVDLDHSGALRGAADVHVELGRGSLRVASLLGYVEWPYPPDWQIALNRPAALPWWGAWSPAFLAAVCAATLLGLLVLWTVAATVYCAPVWALGFVANRGLAWGGAWRLAAAAQLPGALLLTAALAAYGLGWADPVRVLVAFGLHFGLTWLYLVLSPLTLPRVATPGHAPRNPFAGAPEQQGRGIPGPPARENPFRADTP